MLSAPQSAVKTSDFLPSLPCAAGFYGLPPEVHCFHCLPMHETEQELRGIRIWPANWLGPLTDLELFGPGQTFELDLGCGKGRFLLARAKAHPSIPILGVDRMLERIRKIERKAERAGLSNIRVLRMEACYATLYLLPASRVSTCYIFFPDPWPKSRHHKNRLFDTAFLDALLKALTPGGRVHIATDHAEYFEQIRNLVTADGRFETCPVFIPDQNEKTDFELYYEGRTPINRLSLVKPR